LLYFSAETRAPLQLHGFHYHFTAISMTQHLFHILFIEMCCVGNLLLPAGIHLVTVTFMRASSTLVCWKNSSNKERSTCSFPTSTILVQLLISVSFGLHDIRACCAFIDYPFIVHMMNVLRQQVE
jgi:hypothetical protein